MMRPDALNWHNFGGFTKMTDPSSNVYSTDEDESKRIIVHETLSYIFCEPGRIKTKHRQQNFIEELFRVHGQTMFNRYRQIRIHYNGTKRGRE